MRLPLQATRKASSAASDVYNIQITIHEGRKRQVRKMFQAIGHPVVHLKRIAYGNLFLQGLPPGKYRILSPKDLKKIFIKKIPLQNKK